MIPTAELLKTVITQAQSAEKAILAEFAEIITQALFQAAITQAQSAEMKMSAAFAEITTALSQTATTTRTYARLAE